MTPEGRKHWLDQRRKMITASDVAAILGFDPPRSAWSVYVQKKTGEELEDTDEMMMGRMFEEPIAQLYAIKTGRPVANMGATEIQVHPSIPWIGATLDRVTWDVGDDPLKVEGCPLEIKHGGNYQLSNWADGPPLKVQIQLQMQMICTGSPWGAYCAVIGGQAPRFDDLELNDNFFESIFPKLEEFKRRMDESEPPPVESPRDLASVKKLYPLDSGETVYIHGMKMISDAWEAAKIEIGDFQDDRDEYAGRLRAAMGEATFGHLGDGTMLTLRKTKTKKGATYRTLRRIRI